MTEPVTRCVPFEVCCGLIEQVIRETLEGRFFKGTVTDALVVARRRADELLIELDQAEDTPEASCPGLVRRDCPIRCLGLSQRAYRPLTWGHGRRLDQPPRTVGEVFMLAEEGRLGEIKGIGAVHIAEIENALRGAGFPIGAGHERDRQ